MQVPGCKLSYFHSISTPNHLIPLLVASCYGHSLFLCSCPHFRSVWKYVCFTLTYWSQSKLITKLWLYTISNPTVTRKCVLQTECTTSHASKPSNHEMPPGNETEPSWHVIRHDVLFLLLLPLRKRVLVTGNAWYKKMSHNFSQVVSALWTSVIGKVPSISDFTFVSQRRPPST